MTKSSFWVLIKQRPRDLLSSNRITQTLLSSYLKHATFKRAPIMRSIRITLFRSDERASCNRITTATTRHPCLKRSKEKKEGIHLSLKFWHQNLRVVICTSIACNVSSVLISKNKPMNSNNSN